MARCGRKNKRKRFFCFWFPGLGSAEIAEPSWATFGGVPGGTRKRERLAVVGLLSLILLSWTRLERVSHLRSSGIYYFFCYPAPTHWANVCRTSGAWEKQERIARVSNPTSLQKETNNERRLRHPAEKSVNTETAT